MATLMLVTTAANTVLAPRLGRLVMRVGERHTITLENVVLILVFAGYATTTSATLAGLLFVIDGVFFTLTLAQRTYFRRLPIPPIWRPPPRWPLPSITWRRWWCRWRSGRWA